MMLSKCNLRDLPIFISSRDRLTTLALLLSWLVSNGAQNIFIVDNASSYDPLLEFLEITPHKVIRVKENRGPHKALWADGLLREYVPRGRFIVTDCDVVPDPLCPPDVAEVLSWCLDRYPKYIKAGLGLRIDNLPANYFQRSQVMALEERYWRLQLRQGLFHARIDTTFALYRSIDDFSIAPSIRTGWPYVALHLPWYVDSANPGEEQSHFVDHVDRSINNWDTGGRERIPLPPNSALSRIRWGLHRAIRVKRDFKSGPYPGESFFSYPKNRPWIYERGSLDA